MPIFRSETDATDYKSTGLTFIGLTIPGPISEGTILTEGTSGVRSAPSLPYLNLVFGTPNSATWSSEVSPATVAYYEVDYKGQGLITVIKGATDMAQQLDLAAIKTQQSTNTTAIGDSSSGLVQNVNSNSATIGDSSSGLVKDVADNLVAINAGDGRTTVIEAFVNEIDPDSDLIFGEIYTIAKSGYNASTENGWNNAPVAGSLVSLNTAGVLLLAARDRQEGDIIGVVTARDDSDASNYAFTVSHLATVPSPYALNSATGYQATSYLNSTGDVAWAAGTDQLADSEQSSGSIVSIECYRSSSASDINTYLMGQFSRYTK
jgi:hypothetical protein